MKEWIKLWAIVRVSMLETLGRPIALLLTLSSAIWILILPMLQFQRFSEDGRMARDCGLATAFIFGLIFVIGNASRLTHTFTNGTTAAVFVKPVSRLSWLIGSWLGGVFAAGVFMVVQVGVVLLAEYFSPTYQLNGAYANVPALFASMGILLLPLIMGACLQCFCGARFVLTALLLLPMAVIAEVLWVHTPHWWGIMTAALMLFFALVQIAAVAMVFAIRCSAGLTTVLSIIFVVLWGICLNGSAYLQLDLLSQGGAIPLKSLGLLLPQMFAVIAVALWGAMGLLQRRSVS